MIQIYLHKYKNDIYKFFFTKAPFTVVKRLERTLLPGKNIFRTFENLSFFIYTVLGLDPTFIFVQLEPVVTGHLLKSLCLAKEIMIYQHN